MRRSLKQRRLVDRSRNYVINSCLGSNICCNSIKKTNNKLPFVLSFKNTITIRSFCSRKMKGSDNQEKLVYQVIEDAGNKGELTVFFVY